MTLTTLRHLAALALLFAATVTPSLALARPAHGHHTRLHASRLLRHASHHLSIRSARFWRHHRRFRRTELSSASVFGARGYDEAPVVSSQAVRIAMRYLGRGNPTGTRGPWCADFQNLVERLQGHPGTGTRWAPDFAHYGHAVGAVPGAIAVFRGHVGMVVSRIGDRIKVISGNYSHRVGIGWYSIRSAISFRMY